MVYGKRCLLEIIEIRSLSFLEPPILEEVTEPMTGRAAVVAAECNCLLTQLPTNNLILVASGPFTWMLINIWKNLPTMDPLSISMSILTIIGSATATVKVTKSFYNAAEEIDFLLNDLTEADIMVHSFLLLGTFRSFSREVRCLTCV